MMSRGHQEVSVNASLNATVPKEADPLLPGVQRHASCKHLEVPAQAGVQAPFQRQATRVNVNGRPFEVLADQTPVSCVPLEGPSQVSPTPSAPQALAPAPSSIVARAPPGLEALLAPEHRALRAPQVACKLLQQTGATVSRPESIMAGAPSRAGVNMSAVDPSGSTAEGVAGSDFILREPTALREKSRSRVLLERQHGQNVQSYTHHSCWWTASLQHTWNL
jgi:hypothetical protein